MCGGQMVRHYLSHQDHVPSLDYQVLSAFQLSTPIRSTMISSAYPTTDNNSVLVVCSIFINILNNNVKF